MEPGQGLCDAPTPSASQGRSALWLFAEEVLAKHKEKESGADSPDAPHLSWSCAVLGTTPSRENSQRGGTCSTAGLLEGGERTLGEEIPREKCVWMTKIGWTHTQVGEVGLLSLKTPERGGNYLGGDLSARKSVWGLEGIQAL